MRRPRVGEAGFKPEGARRRAPRGTWFRDGTGAFGRLSSAGQRAAARVMLVTGAGMARNPRAESQKFADGSSLMMAVLAFARRFGRRAFGGGK